jgi:hypothetical protein
VKHGSGEELPLMLCKTIKEAAHQREQCVLVPAQQRTKQKYLIFANSLSAITRANLIDVVANSGCFERRALGSLPLPHLAVIKNKL